MMNGSLGICNSQLEFAYTKDKPIRKIGWIVTFVTFYHENLDLDSFPNLPINIRIL
jgi:hypothetical protein